MTYSENKLPQGLDAITQVSDDDFLVVGDTSDSGHVKSITHSDFKADIGAHNHTNSSILDGLGQNASNELTFNGNDVDTVIAQRDVYNGLDSQDTSISLSAAQGKVLKDVQDTQQTKLDTIESNATADQTDSEIATAYQNEVPFATSSEMQAGTETAERRMSPQLVAGVVQSSGGGWQILSDTSVASVSSSLDSDTFTPKTLLKVLLFVTGVSSTSADIEIRFNDDTAINYQYFNVEFDNSSTSFSRSSSETSTSIIVSNICYADSYGTFDIINMSNHHKCLSGQVGMGRNNIFEVTGTWKNTSEQISKVTIRNNSVYTYSSGTRLIVLGMDT